MMPTKRLRQGVHRFPMEVWLGSGRLPWRRRPLVTTKNPLPGTCYGEGKESLLRTKGEEEGEAQEAPPSPGVIIGVELD